MSVRPLLRLAGLPVYQNKMFASHEEAIACPTGTMELVKDLHSGVVVNRCYNPGLLEYDESYQNEQGMSAVFQNHLEEVMALFDKNFSGREVVEIGCGKGLFLERLRERGYAAVGIDPAYEGDLPYIIRSTFKSDLHIKADVIVLRHVLEHIQSPLDFLQGIAAANQGQGLVYIEVPCFDWILQQRAWFDIFYEHVNYFTAESLKGMFAGRCEVVRLFGGQYLAAIADLGALRHSAEAIDGGSEVPGDFFSQLSGLSAAGATAAVWGAGAKGMMFAHHMLQRGIDLRFAIDINPQKQEKYLAGSGLAVLSPAQALSRLPADSTIYIMNPNYAAEIKAYAGPGFKYITMGEQSEL